MVRRVLAVTFVAALALTGCTATVASDSPSTQSVSDGRASYASAPCPHPNVPGVPQLDLGADFSCGYLTVPENRSRPDGRTIRLAVARVKAVSSTPAADPIVYLQGGPGVSALSVAAFLAGKGINANRDVIFVDQRGTYHSALLACPEVDAFLATEATEHFSDPTTGEQSNAATTACHDRLARTGVDLASYATTENASDIADLRVALGIDSWNLYGVSYGSTLAQAVLRDHPAGIRSVVLDSVTAPQISLISEFWPGAATSYRAIFDACAAQPACRAAYPDLAEEFTATVNRLTATPITVPVPDGSGRMVSVNIDGYQLANLVVLASLATPTYAAVPSMIHQMAHGDGTAAATMLLQLFVPPSGLMGYGLFWGVFCREWVSQTSPDQVLARAKAALPGFPDAVLTFPPQLPRAFDDCAIWNVRTAPPATGAGVVSDVPVPLMAGTFDAVTPVAWMATVAAGLKNSQTVPIPGVGHDVLKFGSECPVSVLNAFLAAPTERVDRTCVNSMKLPTFTTP